MQRAFYVVALLAFGAAAGWLGRGHFRPGPPHPSRHPHVPERMLDDAGVSAAQRQEILAIDRRHREAGATLVADLEAKRRAFEEAVQGEHGAAEVKPHFDALLEAKMKAERAHFAAMMEVRAKLSPEQRQRAHAHRPPPPPFGGPADGP